MIIYFLVGFIAIFFAFLAERKKERKIFLFLCIATLCFFSGLRSSSVGIDTSHYYYSFMNLTNRTYSDYGFFLIVKTLISIFKKPEYLIFIFSCVINILFIISFWNIKSVSFPYMVFVYYTLFFLETMNTVRQYLAIAIVFFALIKFANKRKYIIAIILIIIAFFIHNTGIVGAIVFSLFLLRDAKGWKKSRIFLLALLIAFLIAGAVLIEYIEYRYSHYLTERNSSQLGTYNLFTLAIYALTIALAKFFMKKDDFSISPSGSAISLNIFYTVLSGIGLILNIVSGFYLYANRIAIYFSVFEVPFWGQTVTIKGKYLRLFYFVIVSVICLYYFIRSLSKDFNSFIPYSTIWG